MRGEGISQARLRSRNFAIVSKLTYRREFKKNCCDHFTDNANTHHLVVPEREIDGIRETENM